MANLKNWLPDMTDEERKFFDACPKATLFEIARQLGMQLVGDGGGNSEAAFEIIKREWTLLHMQNIVPQKPPRQFHVDV